MPRNSRCIEPALAYHVTQRGNEKQDVFFSQSDRDVYLDLIRQQLADVEVSVLAYCLMTNHVHWVVLPQRNDSLAVLFQRVHGRYSQYLNARRGHTGHLWHGRYHSCIVDPERLWIACHYVERNPVQAGMVVSAERYRWSSAREHSTGEFAKNSLLDRVFWEESGGVANWTDLMGVSTPSDTTQQFRRCTYSGRPFGDEEFVRQMEIKFNRKWQRDTVPGARIEAAVA